MGSSGRTQCHVTCSGAIMHCVAIMYTIVYTSQKSKCTRTHLSLSSPLFISPRGFCWRSQCPGTGKNHEEGANTTHPILSTSRDLGGRWFRRQTIGPTKNKREKKRKDRRQRLVQLVCRGIRPPDADRRIDASHDSPTSLGGCDGGARPNSTPVNASASAAMHPSRSRHGHP